MVQASQLAGPPVLLDDDSITRQSLAVYEVVLKYRKILHHMKGKRATTQDDQEDTGVRACCESNAQGLPDPQSPYKLKSQGGRLICFQNNKDSQDNRKGGML